MKNIKIRLHSNKSFIELDGANLMIKNILFRFFYKIQLFRTTSGRITAVDIDEPGFSKATRPESTAPGRAVEGDWCRISSETTPVSPL